jgi:hypothetical protein
MARSLFYFVAQGATHGWSSYESEKRKQAAQLSRLRDRRPLADLLELKGHGGAAARDG